MAYNYIRQSTFSDGDRITASLFNNEYDQLLNAFTYSSTAVEGTGHRHDGNLGQGGNIFKIGDLDFLNKIEVDSTNNRWGFYVEVSNAAVEQIRIQDGAIVPVTDGDIDLGTSSLEFQNLFLDGTAHVDTLDVDANATVAGTLGVTGVTTLSNNLSVGGNLTVTGNATIAGNLTFGDAATDTVSFSADVASNLLPSADNTYDLGASGSEWKDLYIDGTANIDSLVADTADINGGTIDGATIATSDITVGSGKTLNVSAGTFTLADNQISGDKVEGGTIAATTITTLTSTTGNITSVNATTVDTTNLEATNLKAKDGTAAGSIADSTGVVTLGSSVLTTTDINGGTVDGTIIGGSTAAAGTFTTLTANTSITGTLATAAQTNITSVGTLSSLTTSGAVIVGGNLTVNGTTTTLNTATLDVEDKNITLNKGSGDTSGSANGAGLTIQDAVDASTDATILWDTTNDEFDFSHPVNVTGKITGTGTSVFANLDISGDVDVDGTLETDALTIGGVTSVPFEAADHSKLDGIEASADVTDAANVTAAGALMDSELTAIASVKAMNQGVATTDSPTFAGITTSADSTIGTDKKLIFRDSAIHISSTADGDLSIAADDEIDLTSTLIDVNGNLDVSGTTNTVNFKVGGTQGNDGQVLTSTGSGVQWEDAPSGGVTGISSGTSTTILTLSSANKVGIGQGVGNALALLHLYQGSGSGDLFKIQTGAGGKLLMNSSGNLGIGTDSPSQLLDVNGTVELNNLTVGGAQGSDGQVLTSTGSGVGWEDAAGGVAGISSSSSSGTAIYINSSNKVGIGISPSALFDVYATTAVEMMRVGNGNHNAAQIRIKNAATDSYWGVDSSSNLIIDGQSNHSFILKTNSTERFKVLNSGNMGIGTSSPSELLHVNGTLRVNNIKIGTNNTASILQGTDGQVITSTGSGIAWEDPATGLSGFDTQYYSGSNTLATVYSDNISFHNQINFDNAPGYQCIMIGTGAGAALTSSSGNVIAIGKNAANAITSGDDVIAIGENARNSGNAKDDVAIGISALTNSSAYYGYNTAIGNEAGRNNSSGVKNTYVGHSAGHGNQTGQMNTAVGYQAGLNFDRDGNNTAIGNGAMKLQDHNTGPSGGDSFHAGFNVAIGDSAASIMTGGFRNVFVGYNTQLATQTHTDCIVIGNSVTSTGTGNFTFGSGSSDSNIANGATTITAPSDERYKEEITNSTAGLSFIKDLRPVTFKWKKEKDIPSTQNAYVEGSETRVMNDKTNHGFIAQEVKAVIDSHSEIKDGFDMWMEDTADGRQRLGPSALIPILVKAIQELEARVNELESN